MTTENNAPEPKQPDKYYAVILTSFGDFTVEEFATIDELSARLKALVDRDVSVFSFVGTRLQISKPPFRYIITPNGNVPLFDLPTDNLEPDDTGYLGVDPIHLENPPEIKQPDGGRSSVKSDEFFSDEDENTLNVFDTILPDPDS